IKRTLFDVQNVFRHLVDAIGNREAVPRIMLERFQDQHIERSVNEVWFLPGHNCLFYLDSLGEELFNLSPRLSSEEALLAKSQHGQFRHSSQTILGTPRFRLD